MDKLKQAKEKLTNTVRAVNEEKITLKELVGTVQNETERLEKIEEKRDLVLAEIQEGTRTLESKKKEIDELNEEKVLTANSLGAIEQEFSDAKWQVNDLQEKIKENSKQLTKENDSKVKKIEKLNIKIAFLSDELRNKEDEYGNKINILTSKEIELEDNIKDAEKRIKELVKEEKEAKEKTIVSVNNIEIKSEAVKELKIEISDLEQARKEEKEVLEKLEKETEEAKIKKEQAITELKEEQAKAANLIAREKLVNLRAKEVKKLYKEIGKEINL